MPTMNDYDKGFLEGVIDSEACLQMALNRGHLRPYCNITNINRQLLEKVQRIIGFGFIGGPYPPVKSAHQTKETYRYSVSATGLRRILPQLNLIVKEKQRLEILEYCERVPENSYHYRRTGCKAQRPNHWQITGDAEKP